MRTLTVIGLVALALGCQSNAIRPNAMPPQLFAAPTAGRFQMQLDGLASLGTGSTAIGPGDLIEVHLLTGMPEDAVEPMVLRVSEAGVVEIPHVGAIGVAGAEPDRAAEEITRVAVQRGVYVRPNVNVKVAEQATYRITVLGAVTEPGVHEVPRSGCDVLSSIAAAGGLSEEAGTIVELMRHGQGSSLASNESPENPSDGVQQVTFEAPRAAPPKTERIDLAQLSQQPLASQQMADRDIIVVRPKEERVVHVSGLVRNPDRFELPDNSDLRVLDAIALAGGVKTVVADKVFVIRQTDPQADPVVIQVSISDAKQDGLENLILQSGDLVSVEATVATTAIETFTNLFRITMGVGGNLTVF